MFILDRYVLLGNHIDAWVFGSVDASSGTTVMMEIARALGEKYKTGIILHYKYYKKAIKYFIMFLTVDTFSISNTLGWRPRRSIMLCGWDGEESGKIGSVEHVEEFYSQLRDKAIAYINIDSAVAGNTFIFVLLRSAAEPFCCDIC